MKSSPWVSNIPHSDLSIELISTITYTCQVAIIGHHARIVCALMRLPVLRTYVRQETWTARRNLATIAKSPTIPQTVIEKVVQKYAVGLPNGKVVKAGDYVMIKPQHVMTHDNTGPVISKYVALAFSSISQDYGTFSTDSNRSAQTESTILLSLCSPLTTMSRTAPQKTCPNTPP